MWIGVDITHLTHSGRDRELSALAKSDFPIDRSILPSTSALANALNLPNAFMLPCRGGVMLFQGLKSFAMTFNVSECATSQIQSDN